MPKINQLSFDVANLIAAGEVVERPASAVKELLENAIDAGATRITAEIKRGGVSLIRIVDNGSGMESEDLPVAIRRHATSKIKNAEDLAAIGTLGFRGEALAAISAVSTLTIITKTKDAEAGTMLVAEAGSVTELCEVGCADGTTVTVENLFENVPARRKFLKKDATETQAVAAVIEKIAISRPDVAITFIADGVKKFTTAGDGVLLHVLHALFGRDFASRLLSVSGEVGGVAVSGFVGRPDNARGNRAHQNVFINGRYVRSKTVLAAIERAYTSYMAPERFPVAVLFLDIPAFSVDVNVHPAKLEVKFSDEHAVFEAVYYAVRTALEGDTSRPYLSLERNGAKDKKHALAYAYEPNARAEQMTFSKVSPASEASEKSPKSERFENGVSVQPVKKPSPTFETPKEIKKADEVAEVKEIKSEVAAASSASQKSFLSAEDSLRVIERATETVRDGTQVRAVPLSSDVRKKDIDGAADKDETLFTAAKIPKEEHRELSIPEYRIIGVAFNCYVLTELGDGRLLIIDQHAAHERILFEALKKQREKDKRILASELLLPLSVSLTQEEIGAASEQKEELYALGFAYEIKESAVYLTAIPAELTPPEAEKLFVSLCDDMASGIADPTVSEEKRREKLLYQLACKSAIKGGRKYGDEHIQWLVREVLSLPDVTVCPHGRPIAFYLSKGELDRRFDRIK